MFDHLSLGVSNLTQSVKFYDSALKPLGVNQMFVMGDQGIAAYSGFGGVTFWLYAKNSANQPLNAVIPSPRFHLAFKAKSRAAVDAFYQGAIDHGGEDEGKPGIRHHYHPNYYAAYVFDPDGYKLEAVCHK
jgi:catechol 2,3-dioxygenase-like lactoylglutathione lyase family enzyme